MKEILILLVVILCSCQKIERLQTVNNILVEVIIDVSESVKYDPLNIDIVLEEQLFSKMDLDPESHSRVAATIRVNSLTDTPIPVLRDIKLPLADPYLVRKLESRRTAIDEFKQELREVLDDVFEQNDLYTTTPLFASFDHIFSRPQTPTVFTEKYIICLSDYLNDFVDVDLDREKYARNPELIPEEQEEILAHISKGISGDLLEGYKCQLLCNPSYIKNSASAGIKAKKNLQCYNASKLFQAFLLEHGAEDAEILPAK